MQDRFKQREGSSTEFPRAVFTQEMKDAGYTILCPQMAPIHFDLLIDIFQRNGYNLELLPSVDHGAVDAGLKYVNNDICYPSILVTTGQIMEAVMSGRYDTDKLAVIITQTGGGCRATNYISLIRKALKSVGLEHVPVIALSFKDLGEDNPGFKLTPEMLLQAVYALQYGDLLMMALYRTRPYEVEPGSADAPVRPLDGGVQGASCAAASRAPSSSARCARSWTTSTRCRCTGEGTKPRVGVVGEILVKFHPDGEQPGRGRDRARGLRGRGARAHRVLPLRHRRRHLPAPARQDGEERGRQPASRSSAVKAMRRAVRKALEEVDTASSRRRTSTSSPTTPSEILWTLCNSMGEGWLLTAEMVELIKTGAPNIVCAQPFACLPNHVVGKAVIKELRRRYPGEQHRGRGLRPRRLRGQPAQPHQAHDLRGEGEPGRERAGGPRRPRPADGRTAAGRPRRPAVAATPARQARCSSSSTPEDEVETERA